MVIIRCFFFGWHSYSKNIVISRRNGQHYCHANPSIFQSPIYLEPSSQASQYIRQRSTPGSNFVGNWKMREFRECWCITREISTLWPFSKGKRPKGASGFPAKGSRSGSLECDMKGCSGLFSCEFWGFGQWSIFGRLQRKNAGRLLTVIHLSESSEG